MGHRLKGSRACCVGVLCVCSWLPRKAEMNVNFYFYFTVTARFVTCAGCLGNIVWNQNNSKHIHNT